VVVFTVAVAALNKLNASLQLLLPLQRITSVLQNCRHVVRCAHDGHGGGGGFGGSGGGGGPFKPPGGDGKRHGGLGRKARALIRGWVLVSLCHSCANVTF
jgi:hypothetical protein